MTYVVYDVKDIFTSPDNEASVEHFFWYILAAKL